MAIKNSEPVPLDSPNLDSFGSYTHHLQSSELTIAQCDKLLDDIKNTALNEKKIYSEKMAAKIGEYDGFFNSKIVDLNKLLIDETASYDQKIADLDAEMNKKEDIINQALPRDVAFTPKEIAELKTNKDKASDEFFVLCDKSVKLKAEKNEMMDKYKSKIKEADVKLATCKSYVEHDYNLFAVAIQNHADSLESSLKKARDKLVAGTSRIPGDAVGDAVGENIRPTDPSNKEISDSASNSSVIISSRKFVKSSIAGGHGRGTSRPSSAPYRNESFGDAGSLPSSTPLSNRYRSRGTIVDDVSDHRRSRSRTRWDRPRKSFSVI